MSTAGHSVQVVLVLTSDGSPVYTAMARLLLASLRLTNPHARTVLLCDTRTAALPGVVDGPLAAEVGTVQVVDTPEGNGTFRSRWLKTQVRQLVSGPLLFLDLDVLVREDLSPLFALDADVAAAINHSRNDPERQIGRVARAFFSDTGWPRDPQRYLNSGVLYLADSPAAQALGALWHARWKEALATTGRHHDQTVLNSVLVGHEARLYVLPHRYNAQFTAEPSVARDAAIWHYYASEEVDVITAYGAELQRLLAGGALEEDRVRRLIAAPHPWRRRSFLDDRVAEHVMRLGLMPPWAAEWFRGNARPALRTVVQRLRHTLAPRR